MQDDNLIPPRSKRTPWNKGKLIGAKPPFLPRHVWSIRTRLQIERRACDAMLSPEGSKTLRRTATSLG